MPAGDSFAVQARSRYVGCMQGRMILGMALMSVLAPTEAFAATEIVTKRQGCRVEQSQRQQQAQTQQQQQRGRVQECREKRTIPPVVDPTPIFVL